MIFNIDNNGAAELRRLTGNYYASNDFSAIEMDIEAASNELRSVIGDQLFDKVEQLYMEDTTTDEESELVTLVQRPVALLACLNYFRKNDISHEDSGRKVKISSDGTDKIPWQWQLDRDDLIHLDEYYKSVEILISFLNRTNFTEWTESEQYRMAHRLIIDSGRNFDKYHPIGKSERMYMLIVGFIYEIQVSVVRPAYGDGWDAMISQPDSDVMFAARKALALLSMATALRRLPLQLIPSGVIRSSYADNGMNKSEPASLDDVARLASWLESDGCAWLDRMKKLRDAGTETETQYLPDNDRHNKFFVL